MLWQPLPTDIIDSQLIRRQMNFIGYDAKGKISTTCKKLKVSATN
jgi:hypothetical protein